MLPPFGIFNVTDSLDDDTRRALNITDGPLTWSAKRVNKKVNLYTQENTLDPKLTLVLNTMVRIGVNHLSKTGIEEAFRRIKIYEHLVGPMAHRRDGNPLYISKDILLKYKNIKIEGRRAVSKAKFRQIIEAWVTKNIKSKLEQQYCVLR